MEKFIKYLFLTVSIFLSSCTLPTCVYVFNNTDSDVTISFIKDSEFEKHILLINSYQKINVGYLYDYEVKLSSGSASWKYKLNKPIGDYLKTEGFGPFSKVAFKFQLDRDKKIYVLKDSEKFPLNINEKTVQPDGYPIEPILVK